MGIESPLKFRGDGANQEADGDPCGRDPGTCEAPATQTASEVASTSAPTVDRQQALVEALRAAVAAAATAGEYQLARRLLEMLDPLVVGIRFQSLA